MDCKRILKHKLPVCVITIMFLIYLIIAIQVPYMLDDWNWGSDAGIVSYVTCDQNSRFVGNLIVLLVTRSGIVKNLLMAAVETVIPIFMVQLCRYRDDRDFAWKYLLCNLLIFLMPLECWSQTYSWVSGFANFVTSVLVMLIHLQIVRCLLYEKEHAISKGEVAGWALFTFAGQMIIENLTIYFALLYFCLFVYLWIRDKKIHRYTIVIATAIIAGSALMFSSDLYETLLTTGTAYNGLRNISMDMNGSVIDMLFDMMYAFINGFLTTLTLGMKWMYTVLLGVSMLLLLRKRSKWTVLLGFVNAVALLSFLVVVFGKLTLRYRYEMMISAGFYALVFLDLLVIFHRDRPKCAEMLFFWASVMGVVLPLAVTTTNGARLRLAPMILMSIVAVCLVEELVGESKKKQRMQFAALTLVLSLVVSNYMVVYVSVGRTNRQRLEIIAEAVAEETGEVRLPTYNSAYTKYLHGWDPFAPGAEVVEKWVLAYKDFYGIPREYELFIGTMGEKA